jgi:hypothetical protein
MLIIILFIYINSLMKKKSGKIEKFSLKLIKFISEFVSLAVRLVNFDITEVN